MLPKADNVRFKQYDDTIAAGGTEKPLQDYGLVCSGGAEHRTYYDGTHARYQRGLRSGEPAELRAAHDEAVWYRADEPSGSMPTARSRSPGARRWNPAGQLDARQPSAGLEHPADDVRAGVARQLPGHRRPRRQAGAGGLRGGYLRNLPQLEQGTLEITERNLGWPIMGVVSYYAINPSEAAARRPTRWSRGRSTGRRAAARGRSSTTSTGPTPTSATAAPRIPPQARAARRRS